MTQQGPELVVDSVTGVDVAIPAAGPGARSFAFIVDWGIRGILAAAWYIVAALIYNRAWYLAAPLSADSNWFGYVVAPPAAIYFLYHPVWEVVTRGRTPGKRLVGVQIVAKDGSAPSVGAVLTRNVFRLIDSFPFAYAVGLITTLLTRYSVRIGDLAAGTLLVYAERPVTLANYAERRTSDPAGATNLAATTNFTAAATNLGSTQDLAAAEVAADLVNRWDQLDPAARTRLAEVLIPTAGTNDPTREAVARATLLRRADVWRHALARIRRLSGRRTEDTADAATVPEDYRMLAHDVARARRLLPETRARDFLEGAYAQTHASLHRPAWHPGYSLLELFRDDIPAVVRWLRPHILWSTALFILTVLAGYQMVHTYPDLISLFASPELIATVERGQLWTEGLLNVVPSSVLSLQILTNNIVVSLFAYCAGFLFGLGTLYIVGLNGLMLGAVFAFTAQHGLGDDLFKFVVAHGCVEISVMCLSGAAGAAVGEALVRPSGGSRAESFQQAALRSGKLILACVVLLIGSGVIEGYVSPNPRFHLWLRIAIGLGYWLVMIALLNGWFFWRIRLPGLHTARAA